MKTMKAVQKGKPATGYFSYLNIIEELTSSKPSLKSVADFTCLKQLEKALAVRAAYMVKKTMGLLASSGASENEKLNTFFAVEVVAMASAHIMYLTFKYFMQSIEETGFKCPNVKENLYNLARVFALTELQKDSSALYEAGYFQMGTAPLLLDA